MLTFASILICNDGACRTASADRILSGYQVIITSYLFPEGKFSLDRLKSVLSALGGDRSKLVLDLSCRRKDNTWFVAMNRWQTITELEINQGKDGLISHTYNPFY